MEPMLSVKVIDSDTEDWEKENEQNKEDTSQTD